MAEKKSMPEPPEGLKMVSYPWKDRIRPGTSTPSVWNVTDPEHRRRYGNLVHRLLSLVFNADDLDNALKSAVMQGWITSENAPVITRQLNVMLENERLKPFYNPPARVLNEKEILLPSGEVYRPDRLVILDGQIHVIDYKTGKPVPHHQEQLRFYASLLSDMGFSIGKKILVYLDQEVDAIEV